jgi:hypothetical protein
MSEYRIRETSAIVSESELRAMFDNIIFPAVLDADTLDRLGIDAVLSAPEPALTPNQYSTRSGAVQDALGNWVQAWTVNSYSPELIATNKAVAAADKLVAIKAERDRRSLMGGYTAQGKWFHSDGLSRSQQLGLALLGANVPAGIQWKTMDGSFIPMTAALAADIFAAALQSDVAIFAAAEVHKAAMEASEFPQSYDFSSGWPLSYGE